MDQVDCVVIGAGVVGLAAARALALSGREVLVLEGANAIGTQTSSRNSEVIHAGIYYPQDSLKALLCVQGKRMLYDYCAQRGIGHSRCGKLIVATSVEQVNYLQGIIAKAAANGVNDLVLLNAEQARNLEPELNCVAAVLSPSTGIVDSHALMLSLQGDLENAGGMVVFNAPVVKAKVSPACMVVQTGDGSELAAKTLVNAAGLHAPTLATTFEGLDQQHVPQAYYCKGNYFTLSGKSPFSRLIYPVPEADGLGVHLTLDLGGQAKFGPDVEWVDSAEDLQVNPERGEVFYAEVRKYWPNLPDGSLLPDYAGIRPKIRPATQAAADFVIQGASAHGIEGLVNLFGIESPGLTSALAIADQVLALVEQRP